MDTDTSTVVPVQSVYQAYECKRDRYTLEEHVVITGRHVAQCGCRLKSESKRDSYRLDEYVVVTGELRRKQLNADSP